MTLTLDRSPRLSRTSTDTSEPPQKRRRRLKDRSILCPQTILRIKSYPKRQNDQTKDNMEEEITLLVVHIEPTSEYFSKPQEIYFPVPRSPDQRQKMRLPHTILRAKGSSTHYRNLTQPTLCGLRLLCRRERLYDQPLKDLANMLTGKYTKFLKTRKELRTYLQSEATWRVLSLQDLRTLLLDDQNPDLDLFMMLHQAQYSKVRPRDTRSSNAMRRELTRAQSQRHSGKTSDLQRARSFDKQIYTFFQDLLGRVECFITAKWDFLVRSFHIRLIAGIEKMPKTLWNPHYMRAWQLSPTGLTALQQFHQKGLSLCPNALYRSKPRALDCIRKYKSPEKKKPRSRQQRNIGNSIPGLEILIKSNRCQLDKTSLI